MALRGNPDILSAQQVGTALSSARAQARRYLAEKYADEYDTLVSKEMKSQGFREIQIIKTKWSLNGQ